MQTALLTRFWRAFRNDGTLYATVKTDPGPLWLVLVGLFGPGVISAVVNFFSGQGLLALVGFALGIVTTLVLVGWGWLLGTKMAKGSGSVSQVLYALGYANFLAALLSAIVIGFRPWLGDTATAISSLLSLWGLVVMSTALRETLGLNGGVTLFIVLSYMAFTICALVMYSSVIVMLQSLLGIA